MKTHENKMTLATYINDTFSNETAIANALMSCGCNSAEDAQNIELIPTREEDGGQIFAMKGTGLLLWVGGADTMISEDGENWKLI